MSLGGGSKAMARTNTAATVAPATTAWRTRKCGQVDTSSSGSCFLRTSISRGTTPSSRYRDSFSWLGMHAHFLPLGLLGWGGMLALHSVRDGEPVLPDPPDVHREQQDQQGGEHVDGEPEKGDEGVATNVGPS